MTSYLEAIQNLDKKDRNIPDYYKSDAGFDVIDIANAYHLGLSKGNAIKYIVRAGKKENNDVIADLKKAIEFLNREIEYIELTRGKENSKKVE